MVLKVAKMAPNRQIWQHCKFRCLFQVKTNFRTAITVPEKSWSRFRDIFDDYVEKMKDTEEEEEDEETKETNCQ